MMCLLLSLALFLMATVNLLNSESKAGELARAFVRGVMDKVFGQKLDRPKGKQQELEQSKKNAQLP